MDTMLELNDITKSFTQQRVLEGISLSIDGGESVAIMGPSGSGKSTLLHCMSGVLVPDDGQVRFNGQ
ncbi:ATP-binding cassette domain-containing protein, partial [uncultured Corynebacterium sp.]|uniref:ATP-binding cassette domain-containing protein n=1 Tax=uncultured Corynebacterium sp. TaxID=159447 RepID=UPI00259AB35F